VNPDPVKENRVTATAPPASPEHLNQIMIDAIAAAPHVGTRDPRVLAAIRAVPRHAFVPGASLADAYNPDLAVITKRDTGGRSLSCASVPSLVGAMLAQLDVRDDHRVFEAGAGTGWNAALLATLAGPGGHVTTIDIDPQITAEAAANLERAGFSGVHVATGNAGLGVPENAPYDRAIVTIGSLDVPPAWFAQLRPGGRLVVPLRWRGQTQSVALVLGEDGILRSDTVFLCGFVPMIGQAWEHSAALDPGDLVHLYWDADQDISPALLSGVLDRPKTRIDSGTTVGAMEPLDAIWVRATATDPAVCRISAEPAAVTSGLCTPVVSRAPWRWPKATPSPTSPPSAPRHQSPASAWVPSGTARTVPASRCDSAATSTPGAPTARPSRPSPSTRAPRPVPQAPRSSPGSTAK